MESTARKGFLYEPTKEFNEIDQEQQLDKTSNNFPKSNEEYFHCSCEHCYIMPSVQLPSKTFDTGFQKIFVNYISDHHRAQK